MKRTAAGVLASAFGPGAFAAAPDSGRSPHTLDTPVDLLDLPTPALVLDRDAFDANLEKMARHCASKHVGLRPHAKTHKCPIVARKQLDLGALGICVAKVSEGEVMVDAGVQNVLITSPVATHDKIDRVIALAKRANGLQMVVDNPNTVRDFNAAAQAAGITLGVLIDLDTGTRRTGIRPGEPALRLLETVKNAEHLRFDGVQAYAGHVMHVPGRDARKARSLEALAACLDTKTLMEEHGHEVAVFSGGGTGTYDIDCDVDGLTDLQLGSYPFMDVQYRAIGDRDSPVFDEFEPSLFVLATAISQPVPDRITLDAGFKAFANEPNAKPQFRDVTGCEYFYGGDEHGIVRLTDPSRPMNLGDKFELIVSHCDPTVNLYDVIYPYRNGLVEEIWPIAARGKSQ